MPLRLPLLLSLLLALAAPGLVSSALIPSARAQALSADDKAAIRDVIQAQVEAFRRDDGESAFALASPGIQRLFGTAEIFMDMVRQGYQPVYRPRRFDFGEVVTLGGQPAQRVDVVGPDGRPVIAVYPMTRLPDGSWRIDGCFLKAPQEHQA
jgi:hypothetical protein